MKISQNWLASYLGTQVDWEQVLNQLTQAGLEIESLEPCADGDRVVELKVTPNRGDCLSIRGILREIGALSGLKSNMDLSCVPVLSDITDTVQIKIDAPEACPNYLALVIKNIDNQKQLPDYIRDRLNKSGLRSVSPVVDISNYVMLELGQPLHAFALAKVGHALTVRFARDHEKLKLLTGQEVRLMPHSLVIADSTDAVAAIEEVKEIFSNLSRLIALCKKSVSAIITKPDIQKITEQIYNAQDSISEMIFYIIDSLYNKEYVPISIKDKLNSIVNNFLDKLALILNSDDENQIENDITVNPVHAIENNANLQALETWRGTRAFFLIQKRLSYKDSSETTYYRAVRPRPSTLDLNSGGHHKWCYKNEEGDLIIFAKTEKALKDWV